MTKHPYEVVVMKAAIADLEGLREKAWALARTYAFNQSDHWDDAHPSYGHSLRPATRRYAANSGLMHRSK